MNQFQIKFFLFVCCLCSSLLVLSQSNFHKIHQEQKIYELSVVWKELSYNFANMDNCPGLNMDSLYRAYIPLVQRTKDDFEYYKTLQEFLAHFNNGHTRASMPDSLYNQLSYPLLITSYNAGKLYIDNIGTQYSQQVGIGDEILTIDNMPALNYIKKNLFPYISASNEIAKFECSMFNYNIISHVPKKYNKKIALSVRTQNGIKKIRIAYNGNSPLGNTEKQPTLTYVNKKKEYLINGENIFICDSVNSFTYLRFTRCNKEFGHFFQKHYDTIKKCKNLVVDLTDNDGGDGNGVMDAIFCLSNRDSIIWYLDRTRVNNAYYRAKASTRIYYWNPNEVSNEAKNLYYPYFYNSAFEDVHSDNFSNPVLLTNQYKGNIYVIVSSATASAAEFFTISLSRNPNTVILGKKTAGSTAQPLTIKLPSGIEVLINTCKSYDYKGRDISSGIKPDYQCDFADIYKTGQPADWFKKLKEYIIKQSYKK
jgi:carboxyl-terminal processing protease